MWRVVWVACMVFWGAPLAARGDAPREARGSVEREQNLDRSLAAALTVSPGATCLKAEALQAQIRSWLDDEPLESGASIRVVGDPHRPRRLHFVLRRGERQARREFRDAPQDCGALHALVGLAIAMAIDATVAPVLETAAEPASIHRLSALLSVASEFVPGWSLGLQLDEEWQANPWLSLRAGLLGHHGRGGYVPGSAGQFNATVLSGSAAVCSGGPAGRNLRLSVCLGAALGALHVRGQGYAPNRTSTSTWLGMRAGLHLVLTWGVPWVVDLEVVSALRRPSIEVLGADGVAKLRKLDAHALVISLGPAWEISP